MEKKINHTSVTSWISTTPNNIIVFRRFGEEKVPYFQITAASDKTKIGEKMSYSDMIKIYNPEVLTYKPKGLWPQYISIELKDLADSVKPQLWIEKK